MPKPAKFDISHPTLRRPLNLQKKTKYTITLREKTLSSSLTPNTTPLKTSIHDNNFINSQEIISPQYISSYNFERNSEVIRNSFKTHTTLQEDNSFNDHITDVTQIFNNDDNTLEDFSFSSIRPNLPTNSSTSNEIFNNDGDVDFYDNEDNFTQITSDIKKYYGNNDSELPKYTGDGSPYFPSLTAMWMFIWFTKNNIGNEYISVIINSIYLADKGFNIN
jgi:hypothetical protein